MKDNIAYWLISIAFLLLPLLSYIWFRCHLYSWLRTGKHLSKTKIKKSRKGKKNYWWYEAIHREAGMGGLYLLNKMFTISYPLAFLITVLAGWIPFVSIPICIISLPVYLLITVMLVFVRVQYNLARYGSSVVLLGKAENKIDSVFFDLFIIVFSLLVVYAHLIVTFDLWGITLPHL